MKTPAEGDVKEIETTQSAYSSPVQLSLQIICSDNNLPDRTQLQYWANHCLSELDMTYDYPPQLTIRIVEIPESRDLNQQWRHQDHATNVLSFPLDMPPGVPASCLGDLILCADVIATEALTQHKPLLAHWAHMILHGILHLLGHDHIDATEAQIMEDLEIGMMQQLGYSNPYQDKDDQ